MSGSVFAVEIATEILTVNGFSDNPIECTRAAMMRTMDGEEVYVAGRNKNSIARCIDDALARRGFTVQEEKL